MRAFTGSLLLPYYLGLSLCFVEMRVWCRGGEYFHDWNQHSVILQLHSISLLFLPHHCHPFLPSSLQHRSLVFTYSLIQSSKLQLYSLQPRRLSFTSLHSYFHRCFSSPHLRCASRVAPKNKMKYKSFYCWQERWYFQAPSLLKWLLYWPDFNFFAVWNTVFQVY